MTFPFELLLLLGALGGGIAEPPGATASPGGPVPGGWDVPQAAQEEFRRAVAAKYGIPPDEVALLAATGVRLEEVPVALHLARSVGVSAQVLVTLRRSGNSWSAVAGRYGLGASVFHLPLEVEPDELGPPLDAVYRRFTATPRGQWDAIALQDGAVVYLVNLRFLTQHMGVDHRAVLDARARSEDFVGAHTLLRRSGSR